MKTVVFALAGVLYVSGALASESAADAPVLARTVPVMDTPVARQRNCAVRRALDGRVVCARRHIVNSQEPLAAPNEAPGVRAKTAAKRPLLAGEYLVIGSFADLGNATKWAEFNADFGTEVQRVPEQEPARYRVVVGPLEQADTSLMREILTSVGVENSWQLAVCNKHDAPGSGRCTPFVAGAKLAQADPR